MFVPRFFKLLTLIAFLHAVAPIACLTFNKPGFDQNDKTIQISQETSAISQSAIQVTLDNSRDYALKNLSGRAWYAEPFKLWRRGGGVDPITASFNSTFVINISPANGKTPVAEGLAFILTANSTVPENSYGKWLGIVNEKSNGSSQIVAIEFDTMKSYPEDLDDNHIGLDVGSTYSTIQFSLNDSDVQLSNGKDIRINVLYDGKNKNLSVVVAPNETTEFITKFSFSESINLSSYLPEDVYVGFSAATGDQIELNCVKSWSFQGEDIGGRSLLWVWISVPTVALLILFFVVTFFLYRRRKSRQVDPQRAYPNIEDHIRSSTAPRRFRLNELRKSTGNFNPKTKLGKGGFGTVYKGIWRNKEIAVKRVSKKSGEQEFVAEVTTIGNLNHKNLVKLIGWCYESRELLLVYEYMPNGSLDKFIFSDDSREELTLNWETRLSIINGVAQALEYLHYGSQKRVLHRDIKSSNIMLDSEFNAKLGDFGLARTIQDKGKTHHSTLEIAGTLGYMAPETFLISRATVETDVYSFGVLLMEVVCGRKPEQQIEEDTYDSSIVNWIWDLYKKGRIVDVADPRMEGKFQKEEMERVLILGLACCHPNPNYRPSMKIVLQVLTGEVEPPQVPLERPSFVWPVMPPSLSKLENSTTGSQLAPFSELTLSTRRICVYQEGRTASL
ncbi:hypothetical protein SLEP1_g42921 [Rubroshorea leprosula]|uniref:Protein kinase domain-containing protein n=1 Tax=Rubroshorea leprosula TaxID=152421 RepID=A0AAV5LBE5_9ROSI|nr:hypothetical protein SLEP1_g42921 [Rubroshorea leprosula]